MTSKQELKLLIVTGLSGAGKSSALNSLEDIGFYCVDNLPPALLPKFVDLSFQLKGRVERIALGIDIRGGEFFDDLKLYLKELEQKNITYEIVYLEASEDVLVRRYKESRRAHPLGQGGRLLEAIQEEKKRLQVIRSEASSIIDTSELKAKGLRERLQALYGEANTSGNFGVGVMSFGYKVGIPLDADLVLDVRFLPNPFYIPALKDATGFDQEVIDYVQSFPVTQEFLVKVTDLLKFLLPHYIEEGKHTLLIAIGCTGGQHRSVALTNYIADYLREIGYDAYAQHRELIRREL